MNLSTYARVGRHHYERVVRLLLVLAAVIVLVVVAAALRSTWSPCGLSMLSTITPLAERGRGHRFTVTATWFILGAALGGATLGLTGIALSAAADALEMTTATQWIAIAFTAGLAGLVDFGALGRRPPFFRRQVDDAWLAKYRAWVYGGGFGWQIGFGFSTYIMTAAVPAFVLIAAMSGSAPTAFFACLGFGTLRGLAVLIGIGIKSTQNLAAVHARLDRWEEPVRHITAAILIVVAVQAVISAADLPLLLLPATTGSIIGTVWGVTLDQRRQAAAPS